MSVIYLICFAVSLYYACCGVLTLREHNNFMRELEDRQRLRREKAEKLKGMRN